MRNQTNQAFAKMNAEASLPSVRSATLADTPRLALLAAELFPLGCPEQTPPDDLTAYIHNELSPARFEAFIADPNCILLVAETFVPERSLAGYILIARRNPHPSLRAPNAAELRKLYVVPSLHGTGLASALVHCGLSMLSSESPRPIYLSAFSENARAIAFYKKWGFEVVGEQNFMVGQDQQKDLLMLRAASMVMHD